MPMRGIKDQPFLLLMWKLPPENHYQPEDPATTYFCPANLSVLASGLFGSLQSFSDFFEVIKETNHSNPNRS